MKQLIVYFFKITVQKSTKNLLSTKLPTTILKRLKTSIYQKYFLTLYHKKGLNKMENKDLYINTFCCAVVFIPFITALTYLIVMLMDSVY